LGPTATTTTTTSSHTDFALALPVPADLACGTASGPATECGTADGSERRHLASSRSHTPIPSHPIVTSHLISFHLITTHTPTPTHTHTHTHTHKHKHTHTQTQTHTHKHKHTHTHTLTITHLPYLISPVHLAPTDNTKPQTRRDPRCPTHLRRRLHAHRPLPVLLRPRRAQDLHL